MPTDFAISDQGALDALDATSAARGDAEAFARLYRRHVAGTRARARWILGTDDVDDAIQEVFIRLWHKLPLFEQRAAFGSWFKSLTVRVLLRQRDKCNRGRDVDVQMDQGMDSAGVGMRPELAIDLQAAIAALPLRARDVFVLHDVEGFDHQEIAELLLITPSTSRSQLARARLANSRGDIQCTSAQGACHTSHPRRAGEARERTRRTPTPGYSRDARYDSIPALECVGTDPRRSHGSRYSA